MDESCVNSSDDVKMADNDEGKLRSAKAELSRRLITACKEGDVHGAVGCLAEGADPHLQDPGDHAVRTGLHWAARHGHHNILTLLLDRGLGVDTAAGRGWTPLMFAAREGHLECLATLLERGANIDHQTEQGSCALALAAAHGSEHSGRAPKATAPDSAGHSGRAPGVTLGPP